MENLTVKERKCIRYLANEMSKEDRSVFEIELTIDDELQTLYRHYKEIWISYPVGEGGLQPEISQRKIQEKIRKRFPYKNIYALVAILVVAILGGFSAMRFSESFNYINLKIADKGDRLHFILPDSSQVILNSESTLKYKEGFSPREIWLDGEAFFDVRKNVEKPFIVHTDDMKVKVLGTSFGVNTSNDRQTISLETGKVNVLLKNSEDEFNLLPNEQLIWNARTKEVIKRNFDPGRELAWKEDILLLDNVLFSEAISKINEFYGVVFSIEGESIKAQHITGAFKDQSLEEFISSLEFITNVTVVQETPNHFTIKASHEN